MAGYRLERTLVGCADPLRLEGGSAHPISVKWMVEFVTYPKISALPDSFIGERDSVRFARRIIQSKKPVKYVSIAISPHHPN